MTTTSDLPRTSRPFVVRTGLVILGAVTLIVALLAARAPASTPSGVDAAGGAGGAAAGGSGSSLACAERYSTTALGARGFAFDGTVTSLGDDGVTFAINEAFRGVAGPSVVLGAPPVSDGVITLVDGPSLEQGGRYLVSGDDLSVWACGFTQPYDEALAATWRTALQP
jgi:hypothetical protein